MKNFQTENRDAWLDRWLRELTYCAGTGALLELGCGEGRDTLALSDIGRVVTADISGKALMQCKQDIPRALPVLLDISRPLPFANASFNVIVASLCLHYFTWDVTRSIRDEIGRCLADKGLLLVRINSTNDIHYGASGYRELEAGLYDVKGQTKRFFSKGDISALFTGAWLIKNMEEMTVDRYAKPKSLWELLIEKR
jgi:SAM-dependent methyltransferase